MVWVSILEVLGIILEALGLILLPVVDHGRLLIGFRGSWNVLESQWILGPPLGHPNRGNRVRWWLVFGLGGLFNSTNPRLMICKTENYALSIAKLTFAAWWPLQAGAGGFNAMCHEYFNV